MRDIKFRAFQKVRKMKISLGRTIEIPGGMYYETKEDGDKLGLKIGYSIHNAIFQIGLLNETLMQFTGIMDSNLREIYEGDILDNKGLDGKRKFMGEVKYGYYFILSVESNKTINPIPCHGFYIGNESFYIEKYGKKYVDSSPIFEFFTIIGNVYENPELL